MLDIGGEDEPQKPIPIEAERCTNCGFLSECLWEGARSLYTCSHAVCTLCYLTGHLDSRTAAHGLLIWIPELSIPSVIHLQRQALVARCFGDKNQRRQGKQILHYLTRHSREVELSFGSCRAVEFSVSMQRLPLNMRQVLQARLSGCALLLPHDVFENPELLQAKNKSIKQQLTSFSYKTYQRSDLYAEPCSLA